MLIRKLVFRSFITPSATRSRPHRLFDRHMQAGEQRLVEFAGDAVGLRHVVIMRAEQAAEHFHDRRLADPGRRETPAPCLLVRRVLHDVGVPAKGVLNPSKSFGAMLSTMWTRKIDQPTPANGSMLGSAGKGS